MMDIPEQTLCRLICKNDGSGKAGKIQVIVTKDYSRLGRDYLEVGNCDGIFRVLPGKISANDNYDSV